jgi:hypothetical protein
MFTFEVVLPDAARRVEGTIVEAWLGLRSALEDAPGRELVSVDDRSRLDGPGEVAVG